MARSIKIKQHLRRSLVVYISSGVLLCPLSITGALQDEDLRVIDEPVGDGGGHRGGVKDFPPVSERQVGGDGG
jgi:hypothetical protein